MLNKASEENKAPRKNVANILRLASLLSLVMWLVSCAALNVREPQVSVASVNIDRFDLTHIHLMVNVTVRNPNSFALPLQSMDYSFSINGIELVDDSTGNFAEISAYGNSDIAIPVRVSLAGAYKLYKTFSQQATHTYSLNGRLFAKGFPLGIAFNESDVIELPELR